MTEKMELLVDRINTIGEFQKVILNRLSITERIKHFINKIKKHK
jgi:hypothetical protein